MKLTCAGAAGFSVKVLPNPMRSSGELELTAPSDARSQIALYDETGRLIQTLGELTGSGSVTIDVTALASGTYTVRVRTSSGVELVERVTVTR